MEITLTFPIWNTVNSARFLRGQQKALAKELTLAESLFDIVTGKFSPQNKPVWKRKVKLTSNDLIGEITTVTPPFPYLAEGTKYRFAIMSQDYRKRTTPGRISQGSRGGKAIVRGRKVSRAFARRKRISAGRWHHLIAKHRKKPWRDLMERQAKKDIDIMFANVRYGRRRVLTL